MTITATATTVLGSIPSAGDLAEPTATALAGPIATWSEKIFVSDDARITSGYWRSEVGASRWDFAERGEIIHILEGAMTIQRDGEEPQHVGAGDAVVFPLGWRGVWTVTETLSKFFVIYR